jgi:hypothetical protein
MLDRRGFTATLLAVLAGCARHPEAPPEQALSRPGATHLTDADVQAFLKIIQRLPGQKPPAFQPLAEVDLSSDREAADMVARWQREFRSSYSPEVQARYWKRDSTLRTALSDSGIDPHDFAALLVNLSTAVVRASLDPEIDLPALGRQADGGIASLSSQFDNLDHDPRLSPSIRNARAELLAVVLKETIAYREFLRLLECVPPESVSAIETHRETLEQLMPATETVLLFRKKLESQRTVIQASHESPRLPGSRPK